MTRGGAMPSGTLESPLSISRVRALPTLYQDAEKKGFRMFGLVYSISSSTCQLRNTYA